MAMIIKGRSRCAICGETDLSRPYLTTWGVFFPAGHPLLRFCDAPLHLDCLADWPHREVFSGAHFEMWLRGAEGGWGTLLIREPEWFVRAGPGARPRFVDLVTRSWPLRLKVAWDAWGALVDGGYARGLTGPVLDYAVGIMEAVRRRAPSTAALAALRERAG